MSIKVNNISYVYGKNTPFEKKAVDDIANIIDVIKDSTEGLDNENENILNRPEKELERRKNNAEFCVGKDAVK